MIHKGSIPWPMLFHVYIHDFCIGLSSVFFVVVVFFVLADDCTVD